MVTLEAPVPELWPFSSRNYKAKSDTTLVPHRKELFLLMFEAAAVLAPEIDIVCCIKRACMHVHVRQFEEESGDIVSVWQNKKDWWPPSHTHKWVFLTWMYFSYFVVFLSLPASPHLVDWVLILLETVCVFSTCHGSVQYHNLPLICHPVPIIFLVTPPDPCWPPQS